MSPTPHPYNPECACCEAPDREAPDRELALLLDDGTVVRDAGWRCVADVLGSFHAFLPRGGRPYGTIIDAMTGEQVYPPIQPSDSMGTQKD